MVPDEVLEPHENGKAKRRFFPGSKIELDAAGRVRSSKALRQYLVKYQVDTAPAMVTCWQATTNWVIQSPPKM